jgi:zinc protease
MRATKLLSALALVPMLACSGGPAPAPASSDRPAVPDVPVSQLENDAFAQSGVPASAFVVLPPSRDPVVVVRVVFRAGAADDPAGKAGLTALAARLMVDGGTEALDAHALKETLYPWAAELSAQVDKEMTVFIARVHQDHLRAFLPIFADVLVRPRWDASEFERLRKDALDDIQKRLLASDDEALGQEGLNRLLYAGHPYGHPDTGTIGGLSAITLEDVKAQAERVFGAARLRIGIAGPAEGARVAQASLGRLLTDLPEGAPARSIPPPKADGPQLLIIEKDAPAVAISMGYPVNYGPNHADYPAIRVGASAFGEHRQFVGRLMQRLRGARGLNYGDYAYADHFEQAGWGTYPKTNIGRQHQYFSIWIRPVAPEHGLFTLRAALHEYDLLMREGLTDAEVDVARRFMTGYTRLWEKNASRRLGYALDGRFYNRPEPMDWFRRSITDLKAEQVNAALQKHWKPVKALRIVVVTKDAAAFRDAVLSGAPSPMTYTDPKPDEVTKVDAIIAKRPLNIPADAIRIVKAEDYFQ